jgi:hypothetical protein
VIVTDLLVALPVARLVAHPQAAPHGVNRPEVVLHAEKIAVLHVEVPRVAVRLLPDVPLWRDDLRLLHAPTLQDKGSRVLQLVLVLPAHHLLVQPVVALDQPALVVRGRGALLRARLRPLLIRGAGLTTNPNKSYLCIRPNSSYRLSSYTLPKFLK